LELARLREARVFESLLPEVAQIVRATDLPEGELLRMIGAAKKDAPDQPGALLMYRLRNLPPASALPSTADLERMERHRYMEGIPVYDDDGAAP